MFSHQVRDRRHRGHFNVVTLLLHPVQPAQVLREVQRRYVGVSPSDRFPLFSTLCTSHAGFCDSAARHRAIKNRNKTKAKISTLRVSRRAGGNLSRISLFLFPAVVKMEVLNHWLRSGSRFVSCCGRSVTWRRSCSFLIALSLTKIQFTALGSSTRWVSGFK